MRDVGLTTPNALPPPSPVSAHGPAEDYALTLTAAARAHGVAVASLRALVQESRVRCRGFRPHGRGISIIFDAAELAADLDGLPRCRAAHCGQPGTGRTGYCGQHFGHAGRERAQRGERDLLATPGREWFTLDEAMRHAPAARQTILKAIRTGDLCAEKVGRHWRISKAELRHWAEKLPPGRGNGQRKRSRAQVAQLRARAASSHANGKRPGAIAEELNVSKPTVYGYLAAAGLQRDGQGRETRRLPTAERNRRRKRAAALYKTGSSLREIAGALDSSPSQVRRDLEALSVALRPPRRPSKSPPPTERACEHCGQSFTPRFPSGANRRYCTSGCARRGRAAAGRAALEHAGLLGTRDAARQLGISQHRVLELVAGGDLRTEPVSYPGMLRPLTGIAPDELDRFHRDWARSGDGRRRASLDPPKLLAAARRNGTIAHLVKTGASREEAERGVLEAAKLRRSAQARRRMGRKPATALRLRWQERAEHHRAERERETAENRRLGLGRLGDEPRIYLAVAEEDWSAHPEDWPRDRYPPSPRDPDALHPGSARSAEDRVRKALKSLENVRKQ